MDQAEMKIWMDRVFKYQLNDVLGPIRPAGQEAHLADAFIVRERMLQECNGGIQKQYLLWCPLVATTCWQVEETLEPYILSVRRIQDVGGKTWKNFIRDFGDTPPER